MRHMTYLPHGVIPAALLPFHEDLSIDAPSFRSHLRDLASVDGISAITVNAHTSEVASCSFDEQKTVLELTQNEIGARVPIVSGVYADGSLAAARIAKMAHEGGASALLVFPPGIYNFGQRVEMAIEHFRRIADATDLPLILFQYPPTGGQGYPLATLLKIVEAVPGVRAIKDWSANPQLHERQIRALQSRTPPVVVLSTHSAWLLSSLVLGCDGLLAGVGCAFPRETVALYDLMQAGQFAEALKLYQWMTPMLHLDVSTKLVQNLKLIDLLVGVGSEHMRRPRLPLIGEERAFIEAVVAKALATRPAKYQSVV